MSDTRLAALDDVWRNGDLRIAEAFTEEHGVAALITISKEEVVRMIQSAILAGHITAAEWIGPLSSV